MVAVKFGTVGQNLICEFVEISDPSWKPWHGSHIIFVIPVGNAVSLQLCNTSLWEIGLGEQNILLEVPFEVTLKMLIYG